jgi:membrane associated rhomboid family serine protease
MPRLGSELRWGPLRVPAVVAILATLTALVSIAAAIGARHGAFDLLSRAVLAPPYVLRGQAWRLLTYAFCELDALPFVFAALTLVWIGRDLVAAWGARRFLGAYVGIAVAAALVTILIGLLWPAVGAGAYAGSWIVLDGLLVAWGLTHPTRPLRFFGVVPLTGRHLVTVTLGGTVLYALFRGVPTYVPHFVSELLVLAWLGPVRRLRTQRRRVQVAEAAAWSFDKWLERERLKRRTRVKRR